MSNEPGKLYVVATPIGNLADMTFRAVAVLQEVALIAAEDTRHIRPLLSHYGIRNKLMSLHQDNEARASLQVLEKLQSGLSVALVSDAGTPLLSDPGMPLVKAAKDAGVAVVPIPGTCALIAALSAAGLPVTRFSFEGFAPRTAAARLAFFTERRNCPDTWVFYESSHRILASLRDMAAAIPPDREIVIARELTKLHETIVKTHLAHALALVEQDDTMQKGEFVVIVAGATVKDSLEGLTEEQQRVLAVLLKQCPLKTAVAMAVEITGARKKWLYQAALDLQQGVHCD